MEKVFKKGIVTLTILSLFLSPFLSLVEIANAQQYDANGEYYADGEYGNESQGITGYITDLAPAITQLPLCKGKLKSGLKNLFKDRTSLSGQGGTNTGGADGSAGGGSSIIDDEGEGLTTGGFTGDKGIGGDLDSSSFEAISESEDVNIFDKEGNKKLDVLIGDTKITKDKVSSLEENDTCLKSIARMVIKMLLQKITVSTIAWIQSGYDGNPAFLEQPGEFFSDIAKTEILQFGIEINDPILYPFGKEFIISKALSYNRTFQENAQYSLDRLIQSKSPEFTAAEFSEDFGKGGWNAWIGMTAVKQNNALGFQIMAGKELENRILTANQQTKDELEQADGYLGDQRCVEPKGVTKASHRAALANPNKIYVPVIFENGGTGTSPEEATIGSYSTAGYYRDSTGYYEIEGACKRWEYVTPGQMIATAATKVVNYPDNNLLKAEDLNDAVAAIIDAWIAKSSSDLMQKGFANLGNEGADGSLIINSDEFGKNFINSQVENDFHGASLTNWLRKNNNFNIRHDLTQAFIDTHRTYVDKMEEYNDALRFLIRNVYQLDYCIPGPAPDWKERAYQRLELTAKEIPATPGGTVEVVKGLFALLKAITIYVTPVGIGATLNVGGVAEGVLTMLGEGLPEDIMTRFFYTTALISQSGLRVAPSNQIGSKGDVVNILSTIIESYDDAIQKTFHRDVMPTVTGLAFAEYRKAEGYHQIIENNLDKIAVTKSVISRLTALKEEIDPLSQAQLEALGPDSDIMAKFSRLSTNLVDGDSIAEVVRLIGQAEDKTDYIYEDLLSGDLGCECDLNSTLELETKRMPYPKEMFTPLPGREYNNGVICQPSLPPPPPTACPPGQAMGNNGQCVYLIEPPGLVGISCPEAGGDTPPPAGCIEDVLIGEVPPPIDITCEPPEVSINGECTEPNTPGALDTIPDPEEEDFGKEDETEFNKAIDDLVDNESPVEEVPDNIQALINQLHNIAEMAFNLGNKGFLYRGYYEQDRDDPTAPPPVENQTVRIPKGVLDVNKTCPVLVFGPSSKNAAKRSLKASIRSCKKAYKGDNNEKKACIKQAWDDNVSMLEAARNADANIKTMCGFTLPGTPRDSVRRFEKAMQLF